MLPLRKSPNAKLTLEQVIAIRSDTILTQRELAIKYGVSQSLINNIRNNKIWK